MERRQLQFQALGSQVYLTLIASPNFPFDKQFERLQKHIAAFEQRFSRFRPDSELTQFNESAGMETGVSHKFRELLAASKRMAEATKGVYNPFVLPALQEAGYKGSWPSPHKLAGASDYSDRMVVPSSELHIKQHSASIPAGTALDFGGIGKGYLLDQLAKLLAPLPLQGYWLSLGGDIACAGFDLDNVPWAVGVQHATDLTKTIATVTNTDGKPLFIATSGVTKRRGYSANGSWHHLIDPRTGKPAVTDILTVTVTAKSGVNADVYAKTIVIAGGDQAKALKESGRTQAYVLQYIDTEPEVNL